MKKKDLARIGILVFIVLLLFYPLFYSDYIFTDEVVQLWAYKPGTGFNMFIPHGRYITDVLFNVLFSSITTIREVTYLRLFSMAGWLVCLPVWYFIFKRIMAREGLPSILAFFAIAYLVTMPPFTVSVQWASCLELFLANTLGLVAGYCVYANLQLVQQRITIPAIYSLLATIAGVISLFTYQNGFGCFLLPFLVHVLVSGRLTRQWWVALGIYFFIYLVYFALLKVQLNMLAIPASDRTGLNTNIVGKLLYFLAKPLASAFHFTFIFKETSVTGHIVYGLLLIAWGIMMIWRQPRATLPGKAWLIASAMGICLLTYVPSLVVKENFASNRTSPALNMAIFLLVSVTVFQRIGNPVVRNRVVYLFTGLFVLNAWYNFNHLFLAPVKIEYEKVRAAIEQGYHPGIDTVFFIRPPENLFEKEYGITRSWDEFGVPSTFFSWTPEFLVKQVVFEKTGNRPLAEALVIKNWLGKKAFVLSGERISAGILYIDVPELYRNAIHAPGKTR